MGLPWWLGVPYWIVAVLFSALYGWKARDVFEVKRPRESWAYSAHQAWLNFAGAVTGWAALSLEAVRMSWFATSDAKLEFGLPDAAVSGAAFIGMTGLMPMTVAGFIQGIRELAGNLAGVRK